MTTSADLPAVAKAAPPPATEIPQVERKIARSIMWVVGHWTVITGGFALLSWAVLFGWGQVTAAIDKKIDPLSQSLVPIKAAVDKAADHDARIKAVEKNIGEIHSDVRAIYGHLLKGEPMRKNE